MNRKLRYLFKILYFEQFIEEFPGRDRTSECPLANKERRFLALYTKLINMESL